MFAHVLYCGVFFVRALCDSTLDQMSKKRTGILTTERQVDSEHISSNDNLNGKLFGKKGSEKIGQITNGPLQ